MDGHLLENKWTAGNGGRRKKMQRGKKKTKASQFWTVAVRRRGSCRGWKRKTTRSAEKRKGSDGSSTQA